MTEDYKSAKEVAREIGTDARTIRKFLRSESSPFEAVGQGGRYNFDQEDVEVLRKAFLAEQRKRKTPQRPKVIEVEETDEAELESSDFSTDFGYLSDEEDLEIIDDDDIEEV